MMMSVEIQFIIFANYCMVINFYGVQLFVILWGLLIHNFSYIGK